MREETAAADLEPSYNCLICRGYRQAHRDACTHDGTRASRARAEFRRLIGRRDPVHAGSDLGLTFARRRAFLAQ
jgi:hypothetical protein